MIGVISVYLLFVVLFHFNNIILSFILFFLVFVGGLLFVMFFTTCERKLLGLVQRRVGPRFVGLRGRLQYIVDSLKLLVKVYTGPRRINATLFQGAAFAAFWLSWINFGNLTYGPGLDVMEVEYNIFFLVAISVGFSIAWLLAGWASSSKYALLGCFRAGLQLIGFELLMGTVFLIIFVITNSFNFEIIVDTQKYIPIGLVIPSIGIISTLIFFMETNRPPFDISEAESDLVAGYNVEYSGILFGLFYLGEYLNLFVASTLLVLLFCGGWNFNSTLVINNTTSIFNIIMKI